VNGHETEKGRIMNREKLSRKELTESLIRDLQCWCDGQEGPSGFEPFLATAYSYSSKQKTTWDKANDCFWVDGEPTDEWLDEFEEICGFGGDRMANEPIVEEDEEEVDWVHEGL
jgi:hypothetical protein